MELIAALGDEELLGAGGWEQGLGLPDKAVALQSCCTGRIHCLLTSMEIAGYAHACSCCCSGRCCRRLWWK
jgi:hypothetical protein